MSSITRTNSSKFTVSCFGDFLKGKLLGFRELKRNGYIETLKANLLDLFVYAYHYFQEIEFYKGDAEVKQKQTEYEEQLARIVKEFWCEFKQFNERDFDMALSDTFKRFSNYVDYRLRETFDNFRARIYNYEV